MCGIYGIVSPTGSPLTAAHAADAMARPLAHRGPDGHARLTAPDALLGAHRLRIRDRHPRADQPFTSRTGDVWLACNGEIYNAAALRDRYPGWPWRSESDAEVILPLYAARGPDGLAELDGMFAVALWDGARRRLVLARDRAGEKPLFVAHTGDEVAFASEIPALLALPTVSRTLDQAALADFLTLGCIREPRTPFADIRKLPAGTIATFEGRETTLRRYWYPAPADEPPLDDPTLRRRLEAAVERQLVADVPVGVFLSGGLDSGLLTVLAARRLGADRLHTFSVGFPEPSYDERAPARRLAEELGTRHVEVVADRDALARARARARALGEPIADPALLPTMLLAEEAVRHVTVVLSGEGADELFGGYPTHLGHRWAGLWNRLPAPARRAAGALVERLPVSPDPVPLEFLARQFVRWAAAPATARHVAWFGSGLPPDVLADGAPERMMPTDDLTDPLARALQLDYEVFLRERLLVKADRATMLASLECRAPYLDPALTRAAFATPPRRHVGLARGKRRLREVARPLVPSYILSRRKRGLSVPIGAWLADELAGETERLLAPARLGAQGIVRPEPVARLLAEHRSGRADHGRGLWTLLTLQDWLDHWGLEGTG